MKYEYIGVNPVRLWIYSQEQNECKMIYTGEIIELENKINDPVLFQEIKEEKQEGGVI